MLNIADFDEAYNTKPCNYEKPVCEAPNCFIASPNRYAETVGPVPVRSVDFKCN